MARDKHFKVWLDGKIVDPEHALLSVFTLTRPAAAVRGDRRRAGIDHAAVRARALRARIRPSGGRASIDRTGLYVCDEILICGSAEEVTPVVAVDRLPVGAGRPGPVTRKLQELFFGAARGDDPAFATSLTPVYMEPARPTR